MNFQDDPEPPTTYEIMGDNAPFSQVVSRLAGTSAAAVYGLIFSLSKNELGFCYASKEYLAEKVGFSRPTIFRALKALRAHGFIKQVYGNPRHLKITDRPLKVQARHERYCEYVRALSPSIVPTVSIYENDIVPTVSKGGQSPPDLQEPLVPTVSKRDPTVSKRDGIRIVNKDTQKMRSREILDSSMRESAHDRGGQRSSSFPEKPQPVLSEDERLKIKQGIICAHCFGWRHGNITCESHEPRPFDLPQPDQSIMKTSKPISIEVNDMTRELFGKVVEVHIGKGFYDDHL
jgi:DNA-binding Lrp family transcriptional regulator